MGVGRPEDLLEAIAPRHRPVRLRHAHAQRPQCDGLHGRRADAAAKPAISSATRDRYRKDAHARPAGGAAAYIRHLFMAGEMLGPILLSIHNLTYYQRLLAGGQGGD